MKDDIYQIADKQHLTELHTGHDLRVPYAFKLWRGEIQAPFFDRESFNSDNQEHR